MVPEAYRKFFMLNPVASVGVALRALLLEGGRFDGEAWLYAAGSSAVLLLLGSAIFVESQKNLTDYL